MNIVYMSILKDELVSFMEFIKLSVMDRRAYRYTLSDFDSFLYAENLTEKKLDAQQLNRWLDGLNVSLVTKKKKLSQIKKFSDYLYTLGIPACLPELPRNTAEFKPYVFSADEMAQIFDVSDDLILSNPNSRVLAEFPVLLRILYGCGLRLGEAASLTWDDIDLPAGIITVRYAKNQKQRLVPMSEELTRILNLYRTAPCFDAQDQGLIFKKNNGQSRSVSSYGNIFKRILCDLGIRNSQNAKPGSRGPCLHSLRHTFTLHSLLKAESEGRGFMETIPFLSTYLGHESLMETDNYLKARHELYAEAHAVIADYTGDVFPEEV